MKSGDRVLVFSAYIQRSTVLAEARRHIIEEGDEADPLVPHRDHRVGVHMGSCGHVMHADCWQGFYESLLTTERRFGRLRIHSTDISKREFLCPLCEGISNAVLPLLPSIAPSEEVR